MRSSHICMFTGIRNHERFIDASKIQEQLGKKRPFTVLKKYVKFQIGFGNFGSADLTPVMSERIQIRLTLSFIELIAFNITLYVPTYLSPIETHCSNLDYFPQIDDEKTSNDDANSRLHLARSCIALFVIGFVTIFCAFWTGLSGCWKRSSGAITATSILLLASCLLSAGAMGLWHTVEFFEKEKVVGEDYYQQWNTVLRDNTKVTYDWSYLIAWAGIGACLLAAILLSAAAICLRNEREKEEQLNLQYLMPVYSQKQPPYPPYTSYPQPQIYPGPYYHGSQYGPYNY
nr:uncharacterized protein LOC106624136 isoform X3 [Bactrocera oleae]